MRNKALESLIDDMFVIAGAMIEDNGEDSWLCSLGENSAIAAVFDGSGGLGAKKYRNFSGKTGAYIGSRIVSGVASDWYHEADREGLIEDEGFRTLPDSIRAGFNVARTKIDERIRVMGSMTREYPTTAAAAVVTPFSRGAMNLQVLWAGDSRVYLLDPSGLRQVTRDDLDEMDAYHNITSDGAMNNVVASDGVTTYHIGGMTVRTPFIVMAATDGCFGYVRTPMEFEFMVLSALEQAAVPGDFRNALNESIKEVAEDDYTLSFLAAGFGSFAALKKAFADRINTLLKDYIRPLERSRMTDRGAAQDLERQLWTGYRIGYELFLKDTTQWKYLEDIR